MPLRLKPGEVTDPHKLKNELFRLLDRDEIRKLLRSLAVSTGVRSRGIGKLTGRQVMQVIEWAAKVRIDQYLLESCLADKLLVGVDDDEDICFADAAPADFSAFVGVNVGKVEVDKVDPMDHVHRATAIDNIIDDLLKFVDEMVAGVDTPCENPECPVHGIPIPSKMEH